MKISKQIDQIIDVYFKSTYKVHLKYIKSSHWHWVCFSTFQTEEKLK